MFFILMYLHRIIKERCTINIFSLVNAALISCKVASLLLYVDLSRQLL